MQQKNKLTAVEILQVMETFKKQEKKEAKLQANFLTPGIDAPSTELLLLHLDLYSSWKTENYVLVVKNSSFNHQDYF